MAGSVVISQNSTIPHGRSYLEQVSVKISVLMVLIPAVCCFGGWYITEYSSCLGDRVLLSKNVVAHAYSNIHIILLCRTTMLLCPFKIHVL